MATFPGDMNIGWGFGLEQQEEDTSLQARERRSFDRALADSLATQTRHIEEEESQPPDPLLAVSELEERTESALDFIGAQLQAQQQRITDLEERLRSLCIVVNELLNQTGKEKD